jgi:hypothetical protein
MHKLCWLLIQAGNGNAQRANQGEKSDGKGDQERAGDDYYDDVYFSSGSEGEESASAAGMLTKMKGNIQAWLRFLFLSSYM